MTAGGASVKVSSPHHSTRAEAVEKAHELLPRLLQEFGESVSDVQHSWTDDTLAFSFRYSGMTMRGNVSVTDNDVTLDASLPLMARPFEGQIASVVRRRLLELFPTP